MEISNEERHKNSIKARAMMRASARQSKKNGETFCRMIEKVDEIKDANWNSCFGSMLNEQRGKIVLKF